MSSVTWTSATSVGTILNSPISTDAIVSVGLASAGLTAGSVSFQVSPDGTHYFPVLMTSTGVQAGVDTAPSVIGPSSWSNIVLGYADFQVVLTEAIEGAGSVTIILTVTTAGATVLPIVAELTSANIPPTPAGAAGAGLITAINLDGQKNLKASPIWVESGLAPPNSSYSPVGETIYNWSMDGNGLNIANFAAGDGMFATNLYFQATRTDTSCTCTAGSNVVLDAAVVAQDVGANLSGSAAAHFTVASGATPMVASVVAGVSFTVIYFDPTTGNPEPALWGSTTGSNTLTFGPFSGGNAVNIFAGGGAAQTTATATLGSGSESVTCAAAVYAWLNCTVTSTNTTPGSYITAVTPGTGFTLSQDALGSATETITVFTQTNPTGDALAITNHGQGRALHIQEPADSCSNKNCVDINCTNRSNGAAFAIGQLGNSSANPGAYDLIGLTVQNTGTGVATTDFTGNFIRGVVSSSGIQNIWGVSNQGGILPGNFGASQGMGNLGVASGGTPTPNLLWAGTGAPASGSGNDGDYYFRFYGSGSDHIYFKSGASTWTPLV